jgi:hypothetical protein
LEQIASLMGDVEEEYASGILQVLREHQEMFVRRPNGGPKRPIDTNRPGQYHSDRAS